MKRLFFALLFAFSLVSCTSTGVITPPQIHKLRPGMEKAKIHRIAEAPSDVSRSPGNWEGSVYVYRGRLMQGMDQTVFLYVQSDTLRYIQ